MKTVREGCAMLLLATAFQAGSWHASVASAEPAAEPAADPCAGLRRVAATSCRDALELLTREMPYPDVALAVHAVRTGGGWLYAFRAGAGGNALSDETACADTGPLVLPQGTKVELVLTSRDDLYEWSVAELGIDTALIPGRLESVFPGVERPGHFDGQIADASGREIDGADGSIRVVDEPEFAAWRSRVEARSC